MLEVSRHYRRWVPIVVCAALLSCVPNRMYRPVSVERLAGYTMAYVEFDDQGELWAPAQLYRALEAIREATTSEDGAIVLLFIHGWNHNAAEGDPHVLGFQSILEQVAAEERSQSANPRPVLGVYLGWRGKNVRLPLMLPFSFFNRRGGAERVAGTAATEVIYRVATATKENPASKVVLLGHSFGGRILELSVTQAMVGSVLAAGDGDRLFPADAVILLNPASQAILAKGFIETLEREKIRLYRHDSRGRRYERPLIVSVTSEADRATRWLFPLGLGVKGLSKKFRTYGGDSCTPVGRQKTFYRRTAGHSSVMLSHTVSVADTDQMAPEQSAALEGGFGNVSASYDPVSQEALFSFAGDRQTFHIARRPRALNDSPYWIIRVPEELIASHNDVFGVNTVRLVGAILAVTGALTRDSRTELVREAGMHPIEIVPLADSSAVVLDRDRRLYRIAGQDPPTSPGCIPRDVDASDRIGIAFNEAGGRVVLNRRLESGESRWLTEVPSIHLGERFPQLYDRQQLAGSGRYQLAALDLENRRVFLVPPEAGQIYVADLGQSRPMPEPYARLGGLASLNALAYDPVHRRLYYTDGRSGAVFALEETADGPRSRMVGGDLGLPVAIAADGARDALYVVDASGGDVLRFRCPAELPCDVPTVFSSASTLRWPSEVQVTPDGTVWLASLESQRVVALSPAGELLRSIDRWPEPVN